MNRNHIAESLYCACALLLGATVTLQVYAACGWSALQGWVALTLTGAVLAYGCAYRLEDA